MNRSSKIKVTIITGFLGAGKTTFINRLLKNNPETQFALVENEFGDISIDTKLIKGVDASQMFELKQGCICCTISDEFELVLQELAGCFPNVQHLLIETTGIADPASVIRPFFADENLKEIYQYNGVICLVDAINFKNSPEKEITIKQISFADLLIISKTGKLRESQKDEFSKLIQKLNPFSEIHLAELDLLTKIALNSILQKNKTIFDFVSISNIHSKLESKMLTLQKPLNKEKFIKWLSYTLDIYKNEIYRVKGILCFENEPFEYILQGVGGSFEILEGNDFMISNESKMVFIGKNFKPVIFNFYSQND